MDIVFFGTPTFALAIANLLNETHSLKLVVTQPDKPSGRRLKPAPTLIKRWALEHSIPVLDPQTVKDVNFLRALREAEPEVIVVAAYGQLLPRTLLEIPRYGGLNIHASLLPRYRGAAPIQRAVMDGVDMTGVTIIQMDEGMDTGDILAQEEVAVDPTDNTAILGDKLSSAGANLTIEVLDQLEKGETKPKKQDNSEATYAPPVAKSERELDWTVPAPKLANLIRGLNPAPGAHTYWRDKLLKIIEARNISHKSAPGVLDVIDTTLLVGTGQDALEIIRLQPEGKRAMGAAEFIRGYGPTSGERLGARGGTHILI